jgi:putative transposase
VNAVGSQFARQFATPFVGEFSGRETILTTSEEWFTAAELAALELPGLPADKRSLNRRAKDERWNLRADPAGQLLARRRAGRGGGTEYHASLLPAAAQLALAERGLIAAKSKNVPHDAMGLPEAVSQGRWRWYEAQNSSTKAKAEARMRVVADVELLEAAGMTRTAAIAEAARRHGQSAGTLWTWLSLIDGVPQHDRLPAIAPRYQGGGKAAAIDPEIWELFKSDYLRPSEPTLAVCYAKAKAVAEERGLSLPSQKAFTRRFEKEVPQAARVLARKGSEALRRSVPAIRRSVEELHALELVNMDGHKFDVFVKPPTGFEHLGEKIRPILIGIQDVYSRKLLAWRIGTGENTEMTRLVFADLFASAGIPKKVYLDNGRAFASKALTSGAKTRYRFKAGDEDPTGLLVALGIDPCFTKPYRGQSKPIERAWRELCEFVAKGALCDGAYTGKDTVSKPDNYNKRAVPWAEFVAEVGRMITLHNSLTGRRGGICRGRSFDEVFAESYATAPISKATPQVMRMALLTAETVRVNRTTGEIAFQRNRYFSPFCSDLHGQRVILRFDPEDLHRSVFVYGLDGRYLGEAAIWEDAGFADLAGAKRTAKLASDSRQAAKALVEAHRRFDAAEVAEMQRVIGGKVAELPEPSVIRPVRHRGQTAAALKVEAARSVEPTSKKSLFAALSLVPKPDD